VSENEDQHRAEEVLREIEKPTIETKDVPLRLPGNLSLAALSRVNDAAWKQNRLPNFYVRGSEPVRLRYDVEGKLLIQEMTADTVEYELTNAADFVDSVDKKGDPKMVYPPRAVCRYVLSALEPTFPKLRGVTTIPLFRPDGTVLSERGYDEATALIYAPPQGFEVEIPEKPTKPRVREAKKLIAEMIGDFPYDSEASRANTLALALTPVMREVIDGPVPLAAVDKPSPGSGASLLVETLAVVTSGSEPGAMGATENDEEQRKQITAKLRDGDVWILFDNVNVELKSAALARALTASEWQDRILGVSKTLRVPIRNVWVATANNLELSLEIARRSYWIRLDAQVEKPWERPPEEFKHPELKAWAKENRAELLSALMTLGRYWFHKKQPVPDDLPVMGSFESWSRVLGGVLHAADVDGFLGNAGALYEKSISHSGLWAAFLEVWHETYGSTGVTAGKIADDLGQGEHPALREVLPDEFSLLDENLSRKLGRALGKHVGIRYGKAGYHVANVGEHKRSILWSVQKGSAEAPDTHLLPL
jgi:putative DNA primase/helicase